MPAQIQPVLLAMILCDQTIVDKDTMKRSLIGTFNNLYAQSFPCVHPWMSVYLALTDGRGKIPCRLRMVYLETDKEIFSLPGEIDFKDPNSVAELSFQIQGVRFEKPGLYAVEFLAKGGLLGSRKLQVSQAPNRRSSNEDEIGQND